MAPNETIIELARTVSTGVADISTLAKHTHYVDDGDEALKAIQSANDGEIIEIDTATNERLLRIIDRNLLPVSK